MPKVQTTLSEKTMNKVNSIIESKKREGVSVSEQTVSAVCSELIELGIILYLHNKENIKEFDIQKEILFYSQFNNALLTDDFFKTNEGSISELQIKYKDIKQKVQNNIENKL
jgi:hypothetical protein